tara:strand:- start:201 stop:434 length:234 start_codon:yes stop_codon:yes gene_type:complete
MANEMLLLRIERDKLLLESDWTVLPDTALSDTKLSEWKTYRQALRDLTKTATPKVISVPEHADVLDQSSVTFPEKPA